MARLWQSGAETNSISDEFFSNTGTSSISTVHVRTGTYAYLCNPSASTGFFTLEPFTVVQGNQGIAGWARAYFYFTSFPATNKLILSFETSAPGFVCGLQIGSGGQIILLNSAASTVGSASSALSLNTWYQVELKNDASGATGTLDAHLNGTSFASGNNASKGSWFAVRYGLSSNGTTATCYMDDLALNNASGSSQNAFPGSGSIVHLLPNAQGDANGFATQVGGTSGSANNFSRVDEIPPDNATSYNASNTLNAQDLFEVGSAPSFSSINVVAINGVYANITAADASTSFEFQCEKTSGGTIASSAAITPDSTTWVSGTIGTSAQYPLVLYNDPDGSAWTSTTIASMQIGYQLTAANTDAIGITNIWASIDYIPGSGSQFTKSLSGGLSFTGRFTKIYETTISAGLSFTGSFNKTIDKIVSGALSFTGTISNKAIAKNISGGLSFSGSLARSTSKMMAAGLSFTGNIFKALAKSALTATLSFTGVFTKGLQSFRTLTAALSFAGAISKFPQKSLSGTLSFSGNITRAINKSITATLNFTGSLTKAIVKSSLNGVLSFTGNLIKFLSRELTASLSFSGNFSSNKTLHKTFTATLSFAGSLIKQINKNLSGTLSLSGNLVRTIYRTFTAMLNFSGFFNKIVHTIGNIKPQNTAVLLSTKNITITLSPKGIKIILNSKNNQV